MSILLLFIKMAEISLKCGNTICSPSPFIWHSIYLSRFVRFDFEKWRFIDLIYWSKQKIKRWDKFFEINPCPQLSFLTVKNCKISKISGNQNVSKTKLRKISDERIFTGIARTSRTIMAEKNLQLFFHSGKTIRTWSKQTIEQGSLRKTNKKLLTVWNLLLFLTEKESF